MIPANSFIRRISRRTLLAGSGALITEAVAATAHAGAATRTHAASAATNSKLTPIIVGALFPETGRLGLAGDEAFRGVELASETARLSAPANSRPIRLIRATAASEADIAQTMRQLISTDHASLVLGTCSSTLSFAASAAAELANIPYIELDAPADAITARGFKTLLRTGLTTTDLAQRAVRAIIELLAPAYGKHPKDLKLALLFDAGATDGAFGAAVIATCAAAKLPVLLEIGYRPGAMDLTGPVSRMKRAGADIVIHAGMADEVALFYEAMMIMAWRPRMVIGSGSGYELASTGFTIGPKIDGTMVTGPPLYETAGESAWIAAMYRNRYAASPRGAGSLTSFVGAILVFETLIAGKTMPQSLQKQDLKPGTLANGWGLGFTSAGQNARSFATLQQWRAGRLITIDSDVPGHAAAVTTIHAV